MGNPRLIYLADLVHNYYPGLNQVPLNIAYVAAYAKKRFSDDIEICLFKYCEDLLDAIDDRQPSIVGLSNYSWNESLNSFVGGYIKQRHPHMPIIMGGPNIRYDHEGIVSFLKANNFIDVYITLEGEMPFTLLLEKIFSKYTNNQFKGEEIRAFEVDSCFSLIAGKLKGQHTIQDDKDLDCLPSPYITGLLDDFLSPDFIPLFESNRGCPYTCSYCTWGGNARKRVRKFSLERVHSEMKYVAKQGKAFHTWSFADANFGILPRDVKIAHEIRAIYDKYRPFHALIIWWDKNAKDRMVEIAKILKGLSNAYIAFQTFDPYVEKMINRKNISIDRLLEVSESLLSISERFHTDILLGLPGETMNSHLMSLHKAFKLGFDSIGGGEIRLLKGSDLETDESRKKHNIITKYRLVQEGFGIYKGHFVADFEESIRSTKWITEEEMIKLRVLRALFFTALSGEFNPLMKCLKNSKINIIDLLQKIIEMKDRDPLVAESIDWLFEKAQSEWFETKEDAVKFFSNPDNKKQLLENPTIKLNYDFLSHLILSQKNYEAFYDFMYKIIIQYFPSIDDIVIYELLKLCKARNYIVQCIKGSANTHLSITLSNETIKQLIKINYIPKEQKSSNTVFLTIDESIAKSIYDSLQTGKTKIQTISLIGQKFPIYLSPADPAPNTPTIF